jgi:NADH-quinone oxidoreductase subunit C
MNAPFPKYSSNVGVIDAVTAALGDLMIGASEHVSEIRIDVHRDHLVEALRRLRDDLEYQQLMEIAGVDYPDLAASACMSPPTRSRRCRA